MSRRLRIVMLAVAMAVPVAVPVAVVLAVVLASPATAWAAAHENGNKNMLAVRTKTPPVIDGRLDDAVWESAPPDDRFVQSFPDDGKAPTEATEVRVLYDDDAIYVAMRMHDREAHKIVARMTRRDRDTETDIVGIAFDSRHDHSTAYAFLISAAGVQSDYLFYNDTNASSEWDAVWDAEVSRDAGGWSAELRIPLRVLRFSSARSQEWGFTARRYISRRKEQSDWAHVPQGTDAFVSRMGHLQGLEGLRPKPSLELRPFGVVAARTYTASGGAILGLEAGAETEPTINLGIDLKYGITSNMTLDATVNPDFGQVEADQVELNLSRFESFFPEKRPFFLEGTDIFQAPIQVFYSRRIGRPPSGLGPGSYVLTDDDRFLEVTRAPTSLPIWSALKLTGKLGSDVTIGVLDALTGPEELTARDESGVAEGLRRAPVRNYAVLRGKYSFGGSSYLGVLATAVNRIDGELARASANHDAYVQSVDGNYKSQDSKWSAGGQAVVSERVGGPSHVGPDGRACMPADTDPGCQPIRRAEGTAIGPGDTGFGGQMRVAYQGLHYGSDVFFQTFSPRLDVNDLGFLNNYNFTLASVSGSWRDVKPSGIFRARWLNGQIRTGMTYERVQTHLGGDFHAGAEFKNYMFANIGFGSSLPGNHDPYETGDGAYFKRIPGIRLNGWFGTDSRKKLRFEGGGGGWHDYWDGAWGAFTDGNLQIRALSRLEVDVGAGLGWNNAEVRNWFYGGCVDSLGGDCTRNTDVRTYRFGALTSGSLSFTMRGTYMFSPRLSVQGYAQLFMSQGEFADRRIARTIGDRPFITRGLFEEDPTFTGDFDGDGRADDTFQDTSLNLNLVLRWELIPGTTLIGVYTRSQQAAYDLAGTRPTFRVTGLNTGPTEEVILFKLVYYWT